jgi:hypothetical protein
MDIYLLKIKNISKSFINFFKINPHKHWQFLLYIFFILVSLLIIFSLYLLREINHERVFQVNTDQTTKKNLLKEDILKKVLNVSEIKEKRKFEIINSSSYKDPSI